MPDASIERIVAAIDEAEAAARQRDVALWKIGDVLLDVCGPPGVVGRNDGSGAQMQDVAAELKRRGYAKYGLAFLRQLRTAAHAFPDAVRTSCSWYCHFVAGDPATLQAAQRQADKDGAALTVEYIKRLKKEWADERGEGDNGGPDDDDLAVALQQCLLDASGASGLAILAIERVREHHLDAADRERLIDAATATAKSWLDLADELAATDAMMEAAE